MLNHEASSFLLFPVIIFCFPKREISKALLVLAFYFGIWFATNELSIRNALSVHSSESILITLTKNYGFALTGIFLAYKLFWLVSIYSLWRLWQEKDRAVFLAILSIILMPLCLVVIMFDTTRAVSYGFLGMLIALAIFLEDFLSSPQRESRWLLAAIYVNIIIPSYPIMVSLKSTLLDYPYRGFYQQIHRLIQSFWR
jgi:hypothetical protein